MATLPQGSLVALVTPMHESGDVDYTSLKKLVEWHSDVGTDGLVILGTTGEASTLSEYERTRIIFTCNEALSARGSSMSLVVGCSAIQPSQVVTYCKQAREYEAMSALIVTPYYVKPPQRGLLHFYKHVADEGGIEIMMYNVPGRTGVDLKPATVYEASLHPLITSLKEATGDISRVTVLREMCGKNFGLYSGDDETGCKWTLLGGDGVVSVTANVAPYLEKIMLREALKGHQNAAEDIDALLQPLHKQLFCESNPIPVKEALHIMGRIPPGIRPPLARLLDTHKPTILQALRHADVFTDT